MRKKQRGFTIIELMIVVGIIGVITSFTLPIYTNYTTRAKVAEALTLLGGLKNPMVKYYNTWNKWPSVDDVGRKTTGRYTRVIVSGKINSDFFYVEATMKSGVLKDKQLRMTYVPSTIVWECTVKNLDHPIEDKFLPAYCQTN
jgi:type IV pilus assembly protein PilA